MCGFVRLQLYLSVQTAGASATAVQSLSDLMRSIEGVTENIGGIAFGIGTLLFFYLFFKSRCIPRVLSNHLFSAYGSGRCSNRPLPDVVYGED